MKNWIIATVCALTFQAHGSPLEQQLKNAINSEKLQGLAHAALVQHYTETWNDQRVIMYDLFSGRESLSIGSIKCLPTSTRSSGVCLISVGYAPINRNEFAEMALTVKQNKSMKMTVLTLNEDPR